MVDLWIGETTIVATSLTLSLAFIAAFQAPAPKDGLTAFPADQQQKARCMLSVMSEDRHVSGARLEVRSTQEESSRSPLKNPLYIVWNYKHDDSFLIKQRAHDVELEITPYIAPRTDGKHDALALGGISPIGAGPEYLNDSNSGLIGFIESWHKRCGVNLVAITV